MSPVSSVSLTVDGAPSRLSPTHLGSVDIDQKFGPDNGKGQKVSDRLIDFTILLVVFGGSVRVEVDPVVIDLILDAVFKGNLFNRGKAVRLCNDWDDIDNFHKLL